MIKKDKLSDAERRNLAEAKLSERKKKKAVASEAAVDIQRLAHELEVHQIELEMQNEELVQAQAELEATLSQYAELYAFAPVGYFTLTRDGTIRRANLTGVKLIGVSLSDLIKRRFGVFISLESRITFSAFLDKVFRSRTKEACEVNIQKDGSAPLWVHIEAILDSSDGQDELCYAIVSDITDRKQADEEQKHLSTHDVLTGLYNYAFFMEEMTRLESGRRFPVSFVMADVDHLKQTNDQEGYLAGDVLLKRVAQVLTTAFRSEDMVARIGGDEFAVLLPATDAAAAKNLLRRVQQTIQENNTAHTETPISLSLGVSTAENPVPLADVLKRAELNMVHQKRGDNETKEKH